MSPHTETVLERRTVAQTLRPVLRGRLAAFLLAGAALVGLIVAGFDRPNIRYHVQAKGDARRQL